MQKQYSLGIYEKAMPNHFTLEEKLAIAKQFGYDFMEMSIDETPEKLARLDMSSDERMNLIKAIHNIGIPIKSICLSGHRKYPLGSTNNVLRAKSIDIMTKAIKLACDLGVRIIQIAGYDVYYEYSGEETKKLFLEGLTLSVEIASRYGVILAFETMETAFMDNVKKAMSYVNQINSPYLNVYPDTGNCVNSAVKYNESVLEDLNSGKGHVVAMHLKETVVGRYREIPYGSGHVDFAALISVALKQGVRMFVTEFWDVPTIDYVEHVKFSKDFIDKQFDLAAKLT